MTASSDTAPLLSSDIVIVGGGMVGISLALLLARENPAWRITLIESFPLQPQALRRYQSSFDARSTALSAGSRQILEACGLWSALSQHITPIRQVHVSDKGHFGGSVIAAHEHGLQAVGYVVENAWFGNVLAAALAEAPTINLLAPARVECAAATAEGYRLTLEDGRTLDTALLVLADGAQSRLRDQLGIAINRKSYGQTAIVANISSDRPHRGVAYERFTAEGPVALLPLGEGDDSATAVLIWTRPAHEHGELLECGDELFLQRLQTLFGYRQGRFLRVGERYSYPLELSVAKEQIRRSLVVMGNAAHFLHPVAGQGFNLALRDCQALAHSLGLGVRRGQDVGDLAVLEEYLQQQERDQALTIRLSDGFVQGFSSTNPGKAVLRNLGLLALDLVPPAKGLLARQTMGLL